MADLDPTLDNQQPDDELKKKLQPAPATAAPALSDALKSGAQEIAKTASVGEPSAPMDDKDSSFYLKRLEDLAKEYHADAPEPVRQSLSDAMQKAQDLYNQKSNRNDWLEVAQTLGRAVAQYGAAQTGVASRGRHIMSDIDMGKPIDYQSRNDRALKEMELSNKGALTQADMERQEALDQSNADKANYSREAEAATHGLSSALRNREFDIQNRRADIGEHKADTALAAANARLDRNDQNRALEAQQKDERDVRSSNLKDLSAQQKELEKQTQAGLKLANALQQEDDLSPSQAKKLQDQYAATAAAAGIDLAPALDQYNKEAPKRNREILGVGIPGTETIDKPQAKASLYHALGLDERIQKLKDIKARQQELLNTRARSSVANRGQSDSGDDLASSEHAAQADEVQVRSPDGKIGTVPRSKLAGALANGFTEIK